MTSYNANCLSSTEDFVEYGPVTIKKEKFSGKYEVKEKLGQ